MYHPLCANGNQRLFLQLAYGAVYNLLGERSFGLDFDSLVMANLSMADPDEVHELSTLPIHMGWRRSSIVVDSNGSLLGMY